MKKEMLLLALISIFHSHIFTKEKEPTIYDLIALVPIEADKSFLYSLAVTDPDYKKSVDGRNQIQLNLLLAYNSAVTTNGGIDKWIKLDKETRKKAIQHQLQLNAGKSTQQQIEQIEKLQKK